MYRLAVCEDDKAQLAELCARCGRILSNLGIEHEIKTFSSVKKLEQEIAAGTQFQLLCLDIVMPEGSGMEFARKLRKRDDTTAILFITGSTDYLLEGYDVRPVRYLLKPVTEEKLREALTAALRLWQRPENITFTTGGKTYVLPISSLWYVESINHGCKFHMDGEDRFFWLSLAQAESLFPADMFARCHKSFVVNMDKIREIDGKSLVLVNGCQLDIGSRYASEFKERFTRYLCRYR